MNSENRIKCDSMLYISFNQENTFFSIGTERGFLIYQTEPFKGPYERIMDGGIGIVEMIYNSNFLVLMGGGKIPKYNKNQVIIWDDYENKVISELKFTTEIISIKCVKDYILVVCKKRIYIFDINNYELFDKIDTGDNSKEIIATNQIINPFIIAFPFHKAQDKIGIKNYQTKEVIDIKPQDDSVSKIAMNYSGTLLASTNEHGTIIRIHSCLDGTFLQEFKRGMEKAKINSICFDFDSKFMAVSSSRGTIHIFSMGSTIKNLKEHEINKKNEEKNNNIDNKKDIKDIKIETKKDDVKDEIKEDEKNENKMEENKINEDAKENLILNKNDKNEDKIENEVKELEKNDINKNNEEKELIKNDEIKNEEDNIINNELNNKEEREGEEINKNEIKEIEQNNKEEELPKNTKTFFGNLFGSKTEKSFARVRLKSQESICAFIKSDIIAIVTSDYKYYKFQIDMKNGGDCKNIFEKDLLINK